MVTGKVSLGAEPPRNEGTATSQQRREREKVSDTTRHRAAEGERAEKDTGKCGRLQTKALLCGARELQESGVLRRNTKEKGPHKCGG